MQYFIKSFACVQSNTMNSAAMSNKVSYWLVKNKQSMTAAAVLLDSPNKTNNTGIQIAKKQHRAVLSLCIYVGSIHFVETG